MRVGVTATRNGATGRQLSILRAHLISIGATEMHHGDCIGGDADAHMVGRLLDLRIVGHLPERDHARAHCDFDETREPLPYLERNRNIIRDTELLIAMPEGPERLRSGTWSTVRWARRLGLNRLVIMPYQPTESSSSDPTI